MLPRALTALAMVTLLCAPLRAATTIEDPVTFVKGVYDKLSTNSNYAEPEDIYSPRLAALMALEKKEAGGEVGRMDFDFWVNAQDWELGNIDVSGQPVEGAKDREIVVAKFKNGDRKQEIHFYFEKLSWAGWRLDDVRSFTDDGWTLSLILKYGFDNAKK
jgi:hypothetical protein